MHRCKNTSQCALRELQCHSSILFLVVPLMMLLTAMPLKLLTWKMTLMFHQRSNMEKKTKTIRQKFTQYFSSFKTYFNIIVQCTSSKHKAYIYVTQRLNRRLGPLNPVKCKEAALITVYMARILPCVITIDFQYPSFRYSIVACKTKRNSLRTYISVQ